MIKLITCGKTLSVLALFLAGSVSNALADQFDVNMQFEGVVNSNATWAGPGETVYVSPYTATDTDNSTLITVYCLDWNHNIGFGQDWTADFISLVPTNPHLSDLYYYGSTTAYALGQTSPGSGTDTLTSVTGLLPAEMYDRYLEAAWLFTQIQKLGTLNSANATTEDELNVAAWTLFLDANPPVTNGTDPSAFATAINASSSFANDVYNDLQNAQAAVSAGYTAEGWYAITPNPKGILPDGQNNATQEFLAYDPDPVPEPQAILLFGTLVGILGATRYRRRKQA